MATGKGAKDINIHRDRQNTKGEFLKMVEVVGQEIKRERR